MVIQNLLRDFGFMQKLFSAFSAPPTIHVEVGDSSLIGIYSCNYCGKPCAQRERFQIFASSNDCSKLIGAGNFCLPECAAAHNLYCSSTHNEHVENRHQLLERVYGRTIVAAPHKSKMAAALVEREAWIVTCRAKLTAEEREISEQELFVQQVDLTLYEKQK